MAETIKCTYCPRTVRIDKQGFLADHNNRAGRLCMGSGASAALIRKARRPS